MWQRILLHHKGEVLAQLKKNRGPLLSGEEILFLGANVTEFYSLSLAT